MHKKAEHLVPMPILLLGILNYILIDSTNLVPYLITGKSQTKHTIMTKN